MKARDLSPSIKKARRIEGKTLVFRNAETRDAAFILSLRTDAQKSKFLSITSPEMTNQVAWLEQYAKEEGQAYFVIEDVPGQPLGCVRLYDPKGDSFCWGSWIMKAGAPQNAAIESALMVYAYAVDHLGFANAHFEVRKGNESVCRFHDRFGARRVMETDLNIVYEIDFEQISRARNRFERYLPEPVRVQI